MKVITEKVASFTRAGFDPVKVRVDEDGSAIVLAQDEDVVEVPLEDLSRFLKMVGAVDEQARHNT